MSNKSSPIHLNLRTFVPAAGILKLFRADEPDTSLFTLSQFQDSFAPLLGITTLDIIPLGAAIKSA